MAVVIVDLIVIPVKIGATVVPFAFPVVMATVNTEILQLPSHPIPPFEILLFHFLR